MSIRVSALTASALAIAAFGAPERAQAEGERPNVIYVFSDDHRWHSMSFTESPQVHTPNMSRLAREGLSLTNSISNYPLSNAYRAMLMTGRWPYQIDAEGEAGGAGMVGDELELSPDQVTFARAFGAAGYTSGFVGKWDLGGVDARVFGFDESLVWTGRQGHWNSSYFGADGKRVRSTRYNVEHMTDQALEFIERHADDAFLLVLALDAPYKRMEDAPPEQLALYSGRDNLPDRANYERQPVVEGSVHELVREHGTTEATRRLAKTMGEAKAARQVARAEQEIAGEDVPHLIQRARYEGYHGHVSAIDVQLGRILDKLDALELSDDTIVVYSSDQGSMLGSHGLQTGSYPYEESIRTPFLVRWPKRIPPGTTSDVLFGAIDVLPTLTSLAGVDVPAGCAGLDLAPTLLGEPGPEPKAQFLLHVGDPELRESESPPYRGVRTARHTYVLGGSGPWLLFDDVADPYQATNLVDDPEHAPLRGELESEIARWIETTGDPFVLPATE